jgi:hypothetical protein
MILFVFGEQRVVLEEFNMLCLKNAIGKLCLLVLVGDSRACKQSNNTRRIYFSLHLSHRGFCHNALSKAMNDHNGTPLYQACIYGFIAVRTLLLAHPDIDVNKHRPLVDVTPLYGAVSQEHAECVKVLLARDGIDVNSGSHDGTPLVCAVTRGNVEIVRYLHGARFFYMEMYI